MRYVYQVYMCMYVRMCAYSRAFTSHQCGSASVSPLLWNLVWRCLMGLAPAYCQDLCCPTTGTRDHSSLRSMERGLLFVPVLPRARPVHSRWLPLCVEGASIGTAIAPQGSF